MSETAYAWAPITKVVKQDDGSVMVYGPAADAGVDRDKQRLSQDWLDQAMPAWMAEGGNVREQHDAKRAVGVGVGLTRAEDGTHLLAAAVVDAEAVKKVTPLLDEHGRVIRPAVLTGFSVGIKDPRISFTKADAPNGEVVGGSIIEVSLVDRPSNPRTLFTMVKADAAGALEDVEGAEVEETADPTEDERVTTGESLLAEMKTLVPDLTKADTAGDIATDTWTPAKEGDTPGSADIIAIEPTGPATVADSMSVSGASYMADEVKTETPETPPAQTPAATADTPDPIKVDSPDVAAIVKAAVAEAMTPLKDELTLVKADLVKALAMPETGGPVGMRTASQTAAARGADIASLRAKANEFLAKAADLAQDDPTRAAGYREMAADYLAKADA